MFLKIAAFVVPLGFDTLAIAVMLGLRGMRPFRPAVTFMVFEAVMPVIGLMLGRFAEAFREAGTILGGIVLIAVALHMLKEALEATDETDDLAFTSLRTAALAGFGISVDELAIGFPMGTSGLPATQTIGAIALQTFIVTYGGVRLGKRLGATLGQRTSRIAQLVAAGAFALLGMLLIAQRFVPALPQL